MMIFAFTLRAGSGKARAFPPRVEMLQAASTLGIVVMSARNQAVAPHPAPQGPNCRPRFPNRTRFSPCLASNFTSLAGILYDPVTPLWLWAVSALIGNVPAHVP